MPELAPGRSYRDRLSGEISTGLPGKLHHALVDGFVQTQQADPPAKLEDFQLLAEWVRAGGLHYLKPVEWCAHLCGSLPVVLEKAAAWKRDKKPDPRAKDSAPAQKPAAPAKHYQEPAKRFLTPELRASVDQDRKAEPARIDQLLKAISGGSR